MASTTPPFSAGYGSPAAAPAASRGRGAVTNVRHRFEQTKREAFDDGWYGDNAIATSGDSRAKAEVSCTAEMQAAHFSTSDVPRFPSLSRVPIVLEPSLPCGTSPLRTTVRAEQARKLLSRNDSPDIPFEQAVNPYRGCEHGCVYCYARPGHAYLGYSPGLDFETRLVAKSNAVQALRAELARPGYQPSPINIGSATDAYQPIERTWRLTRGLLELMLETRHPVTLVTKSALIERDLDLLVELARQRLITVYISITTLDAEMARTLEPRASAPWRRAQAVRKLADAGVPVGVLVAPIIPFINDNAMEPVLRAAAEAGACSASYTVVRLPWEVKDVFDTWLHTHFPDRAQRVLHRIEDLRGGKRNDPNFGTRMRGTGIWADLLRQRFQVMARHLRLANVRPDLAVDKFLPPRVATATPSKVRKAAHDSAAAAQEAGQLGLFD